MLSYAAYSDESIAEKKLKYKPKAGILGTEDRSVEMSKSIKESQGI